MRPVGIEPTTYRCSKTVSPLLQSENDAENAPFEPEKHPKAAIETVTGPQSDCERSRRVARVSVRTSPGGAPVSLGALFAVARWTL